MEESFKPIQPDIIDENQPYIFISYSRQDLKNIQVILKILRENHFRFWYDVGMKSGSEWAEELGKKIQNCNQFLVLLSPNTVESRFVKKEIIMAVNVRKSNEICVIYLQETILSKGLQLLLDDIQAIHKDSLSTSDFERALCDAADKRTYFLPERNEISEAKRQLLENYDIIHEMGAGGLGKIFLAKHKRSNVFVLIKAGHFDCTSYAGTSIRAVFENEKSILAQLTRNACPFVPFLLDWFYDEQNTFLVQSYIQGETLQSLSSKKSEYSYTEKDVVEIATKTLTVLEMLERQGIIHEDIKPTNLIKSSGSSDIYLVDFNISTQVENKQYVNRGGTLGFGAPEKFCLEKGIKTNFSSDLYSLGRTLEWLLISDTAISQNRGPLRYYRQDISPALEAILEKMTSRQPGNRYQSAEEVMKALKNYKRHHIWNKLFLYISSNHAIRMYSRQAKKGGRTVTGGAEPYTNISQTTILLSKSDNRDAPDPE